MACCSSTRTVLGGGLRYQREPHVAESEMISGCCEPRLLSNFLFQCEPRFIGFSQDGGEKTRFVCYY
jgi:hypothetical protein